MKPQSACTMIAAIFLVALTVTETVFISLGLGVGVDIWAVSKVLIAVTAFNLGVFAFAVYFQKTRQAYDVRITISPNDLGEDTETFTYNDSISHKENFARWYVLNCEERQVYSEPRHEIEEAQIIFRGLYPNGHESKNT